MKKLFSVLALFMLMVLPTLAESHVHPAMVGTSVGATACTAGCPAIQTNWNFSNILSVPGNSSNIPGIPACNFSSSPTTSCWYGFQLTLTPPVGAVLNLPSCSTTTLTNCLDASKNVVIAACSATVTSNCIGPAPISSSCDVNTAASPGCAFQYTWNYGSPLPYGTWSVSMVTAGIGATAGSSNNSSAATATLNYPLPALNNPTGLTATPAQ